VPSVAWIWGFLVHAQHERTRRRVEVEAHDVAHFLDEQRVGRELERLRPVRLEPEGAPDGGDGRPLQSHRLREPARAPVGAVGWHLLERRRNRPLHVGVADPTWSADPRVIPQPRQAPRREARSPEPDGGPVHPQLRREHAMRDIGAVGAGEHDVGTEGERLRRAAPARPPLQCRTLLWRKVEPDRVNATSGHESVQFGTRMPPAPLAPFCHPTSRSDH
jgi:hypothetical protein